MSTLMASAISTSTYLCLSSFTNTKSTASYLSTSSVFCPNFVPQLGLSQFSPWNGLRPLSISISQKSLKIERKRRYRGKVVYASLFGVGAPEALVIGVVALLVFGPKGLAEVARNLGKTLRAFQPTIRELQEVSREFKSSLEREIGLDESSSSAPSTYRSNTTNIASSPSSNAETEDSQDVVDPNGASLPNRAYTSEEYLKITEEQLKASAGQQQGQMPLVPHDNQLDTKTQPQGSVQGAAAAAAAIPPSEKSGRSTS